MALMGARAAAALGLAMLVGFGACDNHASKSSMSDISAQELLDMVPLYFTRIRREDLDDPRAFDRLQAVSPEYKAWRAKRDEGWERRDEWYELILEVRPLLPDYEVHNRIAPPMSSYEAEILRADEPEPTDGVIFTSLVVRVSYLAPVYEMYESSGRVVLKPGMKRWRWRDRRRSHDIGPAFQPAAEVVARAIEKRYGYRRVGKEVLDIQLFNVTFWEDAWYTGTVAEAFFSPYRL